MNPVSKRSTNRFEFTIKPTSAVIKVTLPVERVLGAFSADVNSDNVNPRSIADGIISIYDSVLDWLMDWQMLRDAYYVEIHDLLTHQIVELDSQSFNRSGRLRAAKSYKSWILEELRSVDSVIGHLESDSVDK